MAYAEKHGRGWRARWHDPEGSLRSASGFPSRKAAETYGTDREAGHRAYTFTRSQLTDALKHLDGQVKTDLFRAGLDAPRLADVIIGALEETETCPG